MASSKYLIQIWTGDSYHAQTLLLFTFSDLKNILAPSAAFALFTGIATLRSDEGLSIYDATEYAVLRSPLFLFWIWINLLPIDIGNQKTARGVEEDRHNKPWRPIPSGRLTAKDAHTLWLSVYPIAFLFSILLGSTLPAIILAIAGYAYNELNGSGHWFLRNILNAIGLTGFAAGALEVAIKRPTTRDPWLFLTGVVIATTIHAQDMHDQVGDKAAGRRTIPLVIGDGAARWTIATTVIFWSGVCPWFWDVTWVGCLGLGAFGLAIAGRYMVFRDVKSDKATFKFYNLWLVSVYSLPLLV